ncbi:MAG: DUF1028 domain-containing protein [Promethearchaeota archaeon]
MTFSICGFDPKTGDLGVAVQSKFPGVGIIVPWAKAGIGAIATQAAANVNYGVKGLELLKEGLAAEKVVEKLVAEDPEYQIRQIGVIDAYGKAGAFTGNECFAYAGHIVGKNFCVQGNILTGKETLDNMVEAFENTNGDLAEKLLSALESTDKPSLGDARGQESAALLVVRKDGGYGKYNDRYIDLRVDDNPQPIKELRRIFSIYDATFLTREPLSDILPIKGEVEFSIKEVLMDLKFLPAISISPNDGWNAAENKALQNWFEINNFENKWRDDNTIWKSVYDFLVDKRGTPMIEFKKMSE